MVSWEHFNLYLECRTGGLGAAPFGTRIYHHHHILEKGETQENMVGQYQGGHERVQDDGRHGTKSKCVAREVKGRPIATWRRPLGEK